MIIKKIKKFLKKNFKYFRYKKSFSSKIKRKVSIGINSRIGPYVMIDGENGSVSIGQNCSVNSFCWIGSGNSNISIGNDVRIGSGSVISCSNHIFENRFKPIRTQGIKYDQNIVIGDDVWIGANVTILPNVIIGKGSVIGGGSVVTKNIEEFTVVAGNPATKIKER